jgi:hypothetical protein
MNQLLTTVRRIASAVGCLMICLTMPNETRAADKLVALYSAHAIPYAMPWVAEELGLFKKYDIDFDFIYIPSSSTATAGWSGSATRSQAGWYHSRKGGGPRSSAFVYFQRMKSRRS